MTIAKDIHASAIETAIIHAYWPELMEETIPLNAHFDPQIGPAKVQAILQAVGISAATAQGIWIHFLSMPPICQKHYEINSS